MSTEPANAPFIPLTSLTFKCGKDAVVGEVSYENAGHGFEWAIVGEKDGKKWWIILDGDRAGDGYEIREEEHVSAYLAGAYVEVAMGVTSQTPTKLGLVVQEDGFYIKFVDPRASFGSAGSARIVDGQNTTTDYRTSIHRWRLMLNTEAGPIQLFERLGD